MNKESNRLNINNILDLVIHILSYAIILLIISLLFTTIKIDKSYYGLYVLLSSIIIYLLNKTIKPILVRFTIPITGLTLGLFYPCINIIILKITDFILGSHFKTNGIITLFFTAILISVMNILMENIIINKILRKGDIK